MTKRKQHELVTLVHLVKQLVDSLPEFDWKNPEPYLRAERVVVDGLRAKGARITEGGAGTNVSFGGVRSGSTAGNTAALRNWLGAARRRLDQQAIERMSA